MSKKHLIALPLVAGLVFVPAVVSAETHGGDTKPANNNVKHVKHGRKHDWPRYQAIARILGISTDQLKNELKEAPLSVVVTNHGLTWEDFKTQLKAALKQWLINHGQNHNESNNGAGADKKHSTGSTKPAPEPREKTPSTESPVKTPTTQVKPSN